MINDRKCREMCQSSHAVIALKRIRSLVDNLSLFSVCFKQTAMKVGGGGDGDTYPVSSRFFLGDTLQSLKRGRSSSALRSNPLPSFMHHSDRKGTLFVYLLMVKKVLLSHTYLTETWLIPFSKPLG